MHAQLEQPKLKQLRNNCHYHYSILTYIPTTIMMIAVSALPAEVVEFRVKILVVGALVGGGLVVDALVGGVTSISSEYRTEAPIIPFSPIMGNTIT